MKGGLAAGFIFMITAATSVLAEQAATGETSYAYLGRLLNQRIQEMDWGGGKLRALVEDAELPIRALAINENEMTQGGRLAQVITTAAVLDGLGPSYRFATELCLAGDLEDETFRGAVIIRGNGDPSLSAYFMAEKFRVWELFDRWADVIAGEGIRTIEGPLIADASAFDKHWLAPGWPIERLGDPDLPSVSALNFNHNCIDVFWRSGKKARRPAEFVVFPNLPDYLFVTSNVMLSDSPRRPRTYRRVPEGNLIAVGGDHKVRTEAHDRAAIEDPARYLIEAFGSRLALKRIEHQGEVGTNFTLTPGEVSQPVSPIRVQHSPPLAELLELMARHDLTLNAETVFKALGRRHGRARQPGSFELGAEAVRAFTDKLRLGGGAPFITDGSGRSRLNRLCAEHLIQVMRRMLKRPAGEDYRRLFPQAGSEGILAERFGMGRRETELEDDESTPGAPTPTSPPPVWAIAGSEEGAAGVAGWVRASHGRELLFALMVDDSTAPVAVLNANLDRLVLEMSAFGMR